MLTICAEDNRKRKPRSCKGFTSTYRMDRETAVSSTPLGRVFHETVTSDNKAVRFTKQLISRH